MQVCVIGGGLAGLSFAAKARGLGMEVILLEATPFSRPRPGEHLSADSVEMMEKLGVVPSLYEESSTPCNEVVSQWGSGDVLVRDALQSPSGMGVLLHRGPFENSFAQTMQLELY